MAIEWSIGGATFDELAVTSCTVVKSAGARDSAVLEMALALDATAPFDVDDDVVILADATAFFRGVVRSCGPAGAGADERWVMHIDGQYGTLDEIPLRQPRACVPATVGGAVVIKYDSKCILGWDDAGVRQNTAEIIAEVMDYATTHDSGFTYADILTGTDITVPQMELTDVTCGEAIRSVLRWHPDAVVWFDHAAGEAMVSRPGTMSTESRAGSGDGSGVTSVQVVPRVLRKVRGVQIYWRTTSTLDGEEHVDVTVDSAGATTGRRIVTVTLDINGPNTVTQEQVIEVEDIPAATGDVTAAWLMAKFPELAEVGVDLDAVTGDASVLDVAQEVLSDEETGPGTTLTSYPNELIKGSVQEWMGGISACPVIVSVTVAFKGSRDNNPELYDLLARGGALKATFQARVMGTDAVSKTYKASATQAGESPVTGLAADYYEALNTDWPEGMVAFVGEDVDIDLHPGRKLSLTGDVAVSGALIQQVTYDVMAGRTVVEFGPAGTLQPGDIVELLRAGNRSRPVVNVTGGFRTGSTPTGSSVIKGATGARQTGTSRTRPAKSLVPWEVTQQGIVVDGLVTVKIANGVVHSHQGLSDSTTSGLAAYTDPVRSWTVLGATLEDVEDGHFIWWKVPFEKQYNYESQGVALPFVYNGSGDSFVVTVTVPVHSYAFSVIEGVGAVAGTFLSSPDRPAAEDVEFNPGGETPDPGAWGWIKIAKVEIDADDTVTITPIQIGAVYVPNMPLIGPLTVDVEAGD